MVFFLSQRQDLEDKLVHCDDVDAVKMIKELLCYEYRILAEYEGQNYVIERADEEPTGYIKTEVYYHPDNMKLDSLIKKYRNDELKQQTKYIYSYKKYKVNGEIDYGEIDYGKY